MKLLKLKTMKLLELVFARAGLFESVDFLQMWYSLTESLVGLPEEYLPAKSCFNNRKGSLLKPSGTWPNPE